MFEKIILILFLYFLLPLPTQHALADSLKDRDIDIIEQSQRLAAEKYNKKLPQIIDEITTLKTVSSSGRTLIYHYQIFKSANDLDKSLFGKKMKSHLKDNVCKETNMRFMLEKGGSYKYKYTDKSNLPLGTFFINISDCNSGTSEITQRKTNFLTVKLPRGIDVQLPNTWWSLGKELKQMIEISVEAVFDLSDLELPEGKETNLISANSMPRTTYASIRIDSIIPPSFKNSEIISLTASNIREQGIEFHQTIKRMLPHQGLELIDFYGYRLEQISGYPCFVAEYRRTGLKGPVITQINQIISPNQEIRIVLAYRESEAVIWKPVIAKIRKSVNIKIWP